MEAKASPMLSTCFSTELQPGYSCGSPELRSHAWKFHQLLSHVCVCVGGGSPQLRRESAGNFLALQAESGTYLTCAASREKASGTHRIWQGGRRRVAESDFSGR